MLFPFASTYMHLLGLNRPIQSQAQPPSPWDEVPDSLRTDPAAGAGMYPWESDPGFHGTGAESGSLGMDPGARRHSIGAGLTAFGINMLEAAPRGDWAGGLARGAAAFSQASQSDLDRARQNARQRQEDARQAAQDRRAEQAATDQHRQSDQSYERGDVELAAWKYQQARGQHLREATGKSADQMVAEIQGLAAKDPQNEKLQSMAHRAAGYALGDDSDLNKLADLHDQMTNEAYWDRDFARQANAARAAKREDIRAGVAFDPAVSQRQEEERIGISREGVQIRETHEARANADTTKDGVSQLQLFKSIQKKVDDKVEALSKQYKEDTLRKVVPRELLEEWRSEALAEATQDVQNVRTRAGAVYHFTADGRFVPSGGGDGR